MSKLILHDNLQSKSMLSTEDIAMNLEVPLKYKNFTVTPSTNLSVGAVSFQSTNVNSMIEGTLYLRTTASVTITGTTVIPTARGAAPAATPDGVPPGLPMTGVAGTPYALWTIANGGFENFCINKAITQIDYDIGGCKWSETGREAHLTDILTEQFSREKKEAWGIYDQECLADVKYSFGSGIMSDYNFQTMVNFDAGEAGAAATYNNYYIHLPWLADFEKQRYTNPFIKQFGSRYVRIIPESVKFTSNDPAYPLLATGVDELNCFYPIAGNVVYYTAPAQPAVPAQGTTPAKPAVPAMVLTQKMDFEIYEPIVSPYLSNPFTKNKYIKSYYAGSAFNLNLTLNDSYIKTMFKLGTWSSSTTCVTAIKDMRLNFFTFSSQRLLSQRNKIVFYEPYRILQPQSVLKGGNIRYFNNAENLPTTSVLATSGKLAYLPQYILIVPNVLQSQHDFKKSSVMLSDITDIKLTLGTNIDLLAGLTLDEIFLHSAETMGNIDLFNKISGREFGRTATDPWTWVTANNATATAGTTKVLSTSFDYNRLARQSKCFIMLDVAKLNANGKLPYVDYGALINGPNNTLTANITIRRPQYLAWPADLGSGDGTVEIDMYIFQKKIRVFDHASGRTEVQEIIFNIDQVQNQLTQYETEEYHGRQQDEMMYVGGAWNFKDLERYYDIFTKYYLPAIGHASRSAVDAFNNRFQNDNDAPEFLQRLGIKADNGLKSIGYGKRKSKYNP